MGLQGMPNLLACLFSALLLAEVTMSAAASMEVKVSTTPIFPTITRAPTKDFQMLLRVEAPPASALKGRVSIDLVAVVDVAGDNNLAAVKKAMKFIIRQLNDTDRLAIVRPTNSLEEFKSSSIVLGGNRKSVEKKVDKLEARSDDPKGSLGDTLKMLGEEEESSLEGRARFIVLVTDVDSSGFNDITESFKYPVYTFGLGASHDARTLRLIAQKSQGTYSFLDDDHIDNISGALALCLGGVKSVAAVGTRVSLKPVIDSGVKIARIRSGGYSFIKAEDNTSGEITIGALYAGEVKTFVVHLEVPAAGVDPALEDVCCHQQKLLVASLDYSGIEAKIEDVLIVQRPWVTVLPKVPFSMVVNRIVQFKWLEIVDRFIEEEILAYTPAEIVEKNVGNKLLERWETFLFEHQFWVGLDLGSLEDEVTAVAKIVEKRLVEAHMFSWVSGYKTQRPTAMGSPEKVVVGFLTVEVRMTLQVAIMVSRGINDECDYGCVDPAPLELFTQGDNDTYYMNEEYKNIVSLKDINGMMTKIYKGVVKARGLKECRPAESQVINE
ncbi:hypothetical protein E2562_024283 [Oryza meyeriana var. granulata]|uniref:VWFA domain-containing protein n=1 Tax=Oryza meyeriana var. granulata TaxID=110450 RepID=A0A6G1C7H7_9ORYZ|nr:hypothetical protein E2562_024283 [Oryza meyeriana var. granulata]